MLAESFDLPGDTVAYLHALVGRAHNAVYRVKGFRLADFTEAIFVTAPRQLRSDPTLRISAGVFYGLFLLFALRAAGRPGFAAKIVGEEQLAVMEEMYDHPFSDRSDNEPKRSDARNQAPMTQSWAGSAMGPRPGFA